MPLEALLTVAAAAEEAETSKTAFYLIGAVFAAWAVVVGVVGFTREAFPRNGGGQAALIAISVALAAGTMASAVLTA